jgi:hypothetical protein
MKTWFELCQEFSEQESIEPRWVECLQSFAITSGHDPLHCTSFESLEDLLSRIWGTLPRRIETEICTEVDAPQAALFVRRMKTVVSVLERQAAAHSTGRLLLAGLLSRLLEIVEGTAGLPRALRVRAAVDFFYSQAALMHHCSRVPQDKIRPWSRGTEDIEFKTLRNHIEHGCIVAQTALGPQRINLLRAGQGTLHMEAVNRSKQILQRIGLAQEAQERKALVAISGGFFLYSEPNIEPPSSRGDPVGLLLNSAKVISAPVFNRATLAQAIGGDFQIQQQGLEGCRFLLRGQPTSILSVNSTELIDHGVVAFSRAWGLKAFPGAQCSVVGEQVLEISTHDPLPIPLNGYVLRFPGDSPALPPRGGNLRLWLPDWRQDWISAMAGGPLLVEDGRPLLEPRAEDFIATAPPRTFSEDETGDLNLLPRMAVGLDPAGTLYLAAVDGRNFHHALGLTLGALAELMIGLGCDRAMNLDGGSSKRMVIEGTVVDQSSTEIQDSSGIDTPQNQRPVRSALFFSSR